MVRVAIIGASGYTGAESIRILLRHSEAKLTYLTALPEECGPAEEIFPEFRGRCTLPIEPLNLDKLSEMADVALCCLPHKVSMQFVPELLRAGVKVVDFSADYRIKDVTVYERYYNVVHTDATHLDEAVYGLPELFREKIKKARLIANPGCFPTGASLALAPLLKAGLIDPELHHRQLRDRRLRGRQDPLGQVPLPEHEREHLRLRDRHPPAHARDGADRRRDRGIAGADPVPAPRRAVRSRHPLDGLQPAQQGIKAEQLLPLYNDFYKGEPFVQIRKTAPAVKDVYGTNYCHIFPTLVKGRIVVFSVIDNLTKGASGQAIQNMNILFGLRETMGLD